MFKNNETFISTGSTYAETKNDTSTTKSQNKMPSWAIALIITIILGIFFAIGLRFYIIYKLK